MSTQAPCGHLFIGQGDPVAIRYGLGAAALRYAEMGYAVVPLVRGGKKPHKMLPLDPGGVYNASRDTRQICAWWSQDPAANVGIATGGTSALAVVDLDVKRGDDGPGYFARFLAENRLALAAGPYASTPSGGYHIWLRTPPGAAVPERKILPGVEIKGVGGLVVAPPSMQLLTPVARPGDVPGACEIPVPYTWLTGCPCSIPPAPPWFMNWIMTAPPSASPVGSGSGTWNDIDAEQIMTYGAAVGERNRTLYRLACSRYRKHGTGPDGCAEVIEELRQAWQASGTAGMPWREVLTIAQSARRFIEQREHEETAAMASYLRRLA